MSRSTFNDQEAPGTSPGDHHPARPDRPRRSTPRASEPASDSFTWENASPEHPGRSSRGAPGGRTVLGKWNRVDATVPVFRVIIGVGALIAMAINYWNVQGNVENARQSGASAIQIMQVWTPHIFYAVMIVGVAVALYIVSRGMD